MVVFILFGLLIIAWPNFIYPYLVQPLQVYNIESRERLMMFYAQDLERLLLEKKFQIITYTDQDFPISAASIEAELERMFPDNFMSPYASRADHRVHLISVDEVGYPVDQVSVSLEGKIGYYSNGHAYKIYTWKQSGELSQVLFGGSS